MNASLPEFCNHHLLVTITISFCPNCFSSLHVISSVRLCTLWPSKGCFVVVMPVSRVPGIGVCPVLEGGELKMDGEDSICALETHKWEREVCKQRSHSQWCLPILRRWRRGEASPAPSHSASLMVGKALPGSRQVSVLSETIIRSL